MTTLLPGVTGTPIAGVAIERILTIPDERGAIIPMLRADNPLFEKFGEIYFSKAYPGIIKGWHLHRDMTLMYSAVSGMAKLVLYDARESSPTRGALMEIFLGTDNRLLVKVPPGIWNGFKCIGTEPVVIANCATHPHDKNEISRLDPFSPDIPYSWDVVHG